MARPFEERFWSLVIRRGPGECWDWFGYKNAKGYGQFDGRPAHRVAYELVRGPIPSGLHVLHGCDTPPCVNPAHLRAGTNAENVAESIAKGRRAHNRRPGENNPAAKLLQADVDEMRRLYAAGVVQRELAAHFGVTQTNVSLIVTGKTWKGESNAVA